VVGAVVLAATRPPDAAAAPGQPRAPEDQLGSSWDIEKNKLRKDE